MQTITLPADVINRVEKSLKEALTEIRSLKKKKKKSTKKTIRFWTKAEWKKAEREADDDIKAGRVVGPFNSAEELIESLHKDAGV